MCPKVCHEFESHIPLELESQILNIIWNLMKSCLESQIFILELNLVFHLLLQNILWNESLRKIPKIQNPVSHNGPLSVFKCVFIVARHVYNLF